LGSNYALTKAKSNLESHFPLVGLTEDLKLTLLMAEILIPQFFKGVNALFDHQLSGN